MVNYQFTVEHNGIISKLAKSMNKIDMFSCKLLNYQWVYSHAIPTKSHLFIVKHGVVVDSVGGYGGCYELII